MDTIKTYTVGEMLDNIKIGELAIQVSGENVGVRIFVDPKDKVLKYYEKKKKPVTFYLSDTKSEKSRWILVKF